jgi:citrate lyase subunit beta/citryl-CoA lyase
MNQPLTLLYVPADRPDRMRKAVRAGADAVIVDLEDAVAASQKDDARRNLALVTELEGTGTPIQVRVNAPGTIWFEADLAAVGALPEAVGIRVPKVEDPAVLHRLPARVGDRLTHALIETGRGITVMSDIASAATGSIGLGEADVRSEFGIAGGPTLEWLRIQLVVAARGAGLPAPAMSAYPNVTDEEGLEADCRRGRSLGYVGRTAIHPRQLSVIRRAFRPEPEEYERARAVLEAMQRATDAGSGVMVLDDGRFLDRAMIRGAETTVHLYERSTTPD